MGNKHIWALKGNPDTEVLKGFVLVGYIFGIASDNHPSVYE